MPSFLSSSFLSFLAARLSTSPFARLRVCVRRARCRVVADELKKGNTIEPQFYDSATIYFSDM